jgi:hypothetical protein
VISLDYGVQLVTRGEWGARAPRSWTAINARFGSTGHWEGPEMGYPWDHASCAPKVRGIQAFHMDYRGWVDIAYSGVACPHGYLFEGRGPGKRTAANGTNVGNDTAYAVCYLGGQNDGFTDAGELAMRAGFNWLQREGAAGPGRNGHRDWKPTECPGNEIYSWIHRGQPIDQPPPPTPNVKDDVVYALVQGAKPDASGNLVPSSPEWWLTNMIDARHVESAGAGGEAAFWIYTIRASGGIIITGPNNGPLLWPQEFVDNLRKVVNGVTVGG